MPNRTVDFSKLSVLLIEGSDAMRSAIYYMLRDMGVTRLITQSAGHRVMETLEEHRVDLVLLGHNGRESITGIQLLEEARYLGLMRPTTGWVFMTSDSSQEVVLHAIDSRPDELLTKPFSRDELERRLTHIVKRKRALRYVDEALEEEDLESALVACDQIERSSAVYDEAQLIKAQTLISMGSADEAMQMLERKYWETPDKEVGVCLAEALIALERFDDADAILQQLIETYPLFIRAYDLLAMLQETQGDLMMATDTLHEATKKAPLGIPRQMELGRVATQSKTFELAKHAFKRSILLGKHSCYRSPEPFLKLANIDRLQIEGSNPRAQTELHNEIETVLREAEASFPKDPQLKVKTALLRSQMFHALGDETEAAHAQKDAEARNLVLDPPMDLKREAALLSSDAVPVLQPIKLAHAEAESGNESSRKERNPEMAAKVNRLGIKHYVSGKLPQAIRYFGMATEYDPGNAASFLNLAQLFLESARDDANKREERFRMVDRYLRLTERLSLSGEVEERHHLLREYRSGDPEEMPSGSLGVLLK